MEWNYRRRRRVSFAQWDQMPHQAYPANFLIETECLRDGVLLADQEGVGNVYTFSECPERTKLIKFDETAICWLALATILIEHEKRQTHRGCTPAGCIYRPVNGTELLPATTGII